MKENLKEHWEIIYKTKQPNEVSWTQDVPAVSLEFIHKFHIPKAAKIIDIGGGDSKLVDFLLTEGYTNVSVLDISEAAILRAKERLGNDVNKVKWIVSDILDFKPNEMYDVWHDRAAFHFQTDPEKIEKYLNIVKNATNGMVIIGTFSVDGPKKCSGLEIRQYDEDGMKEKFEKSDFKNVECKREDHITPTGAVQNFVFCSFMKQLAHSNLQEV
ncbi:MAG: class I SAM-dependent methyltransferase [Chitinophagaceae bacterium]|nr:class I SAM-dependent methyltransferase [Chitinophagaceae bacterium]